MRNETNDTAALKIFIKNKLPRSRIIHSQINLSHTPYSPTNTHTHIPRKFSSHGEFPFEIAVSEINTSLQAQANKAGKACPDPDVISFFDSLAAFSLAVSIRVYIRIYIYTGNCQRCIYIYIRNYYFEISFNSRFTQHIYSIVVVVYRVKEQQQQLLAYVSERMDFRKFVARRIVLYCDAGKDSEINLLGLCRCGFISEVGRSFEL